MTTLADTVKGMVDISWPQIDIDSTKSNQIYIQFTDGEAAIFGKFGELSDNYPATTRVAMCVTHLALRRITKFVLFASIAENTLKGCYNLCRLDWKLAAKQILLRNGECILNIFIHPFLSLGLLPFIVLKPSFFEPSNVFNDEHLFKPPVEIISRALRPFFSQVEQTGVQTRR